MREGEQAGRQRREEEKEIRDNSVIRVSNGHFRGLSTLKCTSTFLRKLSTCVHNVETNLRVNKIAKSSPMRYA
jgi:hypothetical protein